MFFSGSMSATRTCSSILWMLALIGPNSITCGQMREMKRPSLVPPVVESSVSSPVSAADRLLHRATSSPGVVRKGWPPTVQAMP
jgi:hypothetical protein